MIETDEKGIEDYGKQLKKSAKFLDNAMKQICKETEERVKKNYLLRNKPLPIQKWGLDKKSQKRVEKELMKWYNMFVVQANGRTGTVYRSDFTVEDGIFYFTNCQDIEGIEQEDNIRASLLIRERKRKILHQLLILNLLGKAPHIDAKCTHCGGEIYVGAVDTGHFYFCKRCGKLDCSTYVHLPGNHIENVKQYLLQKGFVKERVDE